MRRFPGFIVIFGIIAIAAVAVKAPAQNGPPRGQDDGVEAAISNLLATEMPETKIKGMRVDPGYLYGLAPDTTSTVQMVVDDAAAAGVNTIFLLTYSSVYGAYYKTNYSDTIVEGGYGAADFLGQLLPAAHGKGIKVIAWLPVNNFKNVWTANSGWRSKKSCSTLFAWLP
jgi:uncharacterized lipoprotein YddW (UPF0748 family)